MSDNETTTVLPQTFVECGFCGENIDITWFCKNCPASLCDACANDHKTKRKYGSHAVVPRTYTVLRLYGPAKIAIQCKIHQEKEISSYCEDCKVPCCISCLAKNHKRHDFSTIEDKYLDAESSLNDYYRMLDTDVRQILDKMEERVRVNDEEDNSHADAVVDEINNFRKGIVNDFHNACDDLITEVRNYSSNNNEVLNIIKKSRENMETCKREIEEKIRHGNLDLMKYVPPKLDSILPELHVTRPSKIIPIFEPSSKLLDALKESVGCIHLKKTSLKEKKSYVESEHKVEVEDDPMVNTEVPSMTATINIQKRCSFVSEIDITSIETTADNMAWFMDCDRPTMFLYNEEGEIVRSVEVEGSEGINDMAITKTGTIIVACSDKRVRGISVNGDVSTLISSGPFDCEGICLTDEEEVVVCMSGQEDKNHVAVYSSDLMIKLHMIGVGENKDFNPYRVVKNGQNLCVVNKGISVVCLDQKSDLKWEYDGKQAKLGRPFNPRSICVDQFHNLLITDYTNYCVHYIDREGGLIQVILTQKQAGIRCHWGIGFDNGKKQVWVGNSLQKVVIAKYVD